MELIYVLLECLWGVLLGWWFFARPKNRTLKEAKKLEQALLPFEINPGEIENIGQAIWMDESALLQVRSALAAWRLYMKEIE